VAKRSVRRQRRYERLGPRLAVVKAPECEAEDCTAFPLSRVYLAELDREVDVCSTHAKLLEIQIARNKNVETYGKSVQEAQDRRLLERELGLS